MTDLADDLGGDGRRRRAPRCAPRLRPRLGRCWRPGWSWSCRVDVEHVADDLFAYAAADRDRDAGAGPVRAVRRTRRRPARRAEHDDPHTTRRRATPGWCGSSTPAAGCSPRLARTRPPTPAAATRTASPTRTASRRWAPSRCCCTCTTSPGRWAWRGTPTRTSYDGCWTGSSRTSRPESPWPTLLAASRGRDARPRPLDRWRWDGTVRSRPTARAPAGEQRRRPGLELAEQRRSSALSSWARQNRTAPRRSRSGATAARTARRPSGESGSGRPAGLDVGEPRLGALGLAEHLAQVALARRQADGRPSPAGAGRPGVRIRLPVCGSPWVTTHRSACRRPRPPSSANRRSAARSDRRPRRAAGRRGTDHGPPVHTSSSRQRSQVLGARSRGAPDPGPPARQVPAGGAAGAARRAGRATSTRPRSRRLDGSGADRRAVEVRRQREQQPRGQVRRRRGRRG